MQTAMEYVRQRQDVEEPIELLECRICGDYAKVAPDTELVVWRKAMGTTPREF